MSWIIYSFFIVISTLAFIQSNSWSWLFLTMCSVFLLIRKRMIKYLPFSLLFIFFLDPRLKNASLSPQVTGIVTKVESAYFIIAGKDEKVWVWNNKMPKMGSKITVEGTPLKWSKENFYSFDKEKYYKRKNIRYYLDKSKITSPYSSSVKKVNSKIMSWFNLVFLNKKDKLGSSIYKEFQKLGIAHLVVISSFHLGIAFLFIRKYFGRWIGFFLILWFSWYIKFPTPSLKALLVIGLSIIFNKLSSLVIISIAGLIIITINPMLVTEPSLLMTIGFGILIILIPKTSKFKRILSFKLVGTGIQWIFTGSIYFMNFLFIFISPIIFIIYIAILFRMTWVLDLSHKFLIWLNTFNLPLVIGMNSTLLLPLLLTTIIFAISISSWHMKKMKYFLFIIILLTSIKYIKNNESYVTFINVGQGDAILIKENNKSYMVDIGREKDYEYSIKPYLLKEGINEIEALFISHKHEDHMGGIKGIKKDIKFKNIIWDLKGRYDNFENINRGGFSNINDSSNVLYYSFKGTSFLFTGDIGKPAEDYIIENFSLNIDVLKVAHHGSNTSTTLDFIDAIQPKIAIISVGRNGYGHPSDLVINRLRSRGIEVYITQENGAIKYKLGKGQNRIVNMVK